jgi:hypothetical protein
VPSLVAVTSEDPTVANSPLEIAFRVPKPFSQHDALADLSTSLPSTDISFAKNISVNSHGLPNANLGGGSEDRVFV